MENTFWEAARKRRSVYGFTDEQPIAEQEIVSIAEKALLLVPSSYNSQSSRIAVLFGRHHRRLWDIVLEALKKETDEKGFARSRKKVETSFASGYGTMLFFVDSQPVDALIEKFPLYADQFALWAQQSAGMHQFAVWTALADVGLGASLQHYNPLIDEAVAAEWDLPATWALSAQMPFGVAAQPPEPKEKLPLEGRLKVFR
ncbi:MAG: nitroreductase family protein [Clostridiales bacterium]|nr:nitroreductase family protein [Clostridiales bacterium]